MQSKVLQNKTKEIPCYSYSPKGKLQLDPANVNFSL